MRKFFRYPKLVKRWRVLPQKGFGSVRQKNSKQKIVTPSLTFTLSLSLSLSFSYPKNFSIPERFWNTEEFPDENF